MRDLISSRSRKFLVSIRRLNSMTGTVGRPDWRIVVLSSSSRLSFTDSLSSWLSFECSSSFISSLEFELASFELQVSMASLPFSEIGAIVQWFMNWEACGSRYMVAAREAVGWVRSVM